MKSKIAITELKKRSPQAIEQLYANNFPLVLKFVTTNTGSMDEARDIFHDAVFILLARLNENQLDDSANLRLHIYSIARILWLDLMSEKLMDKSNVQHVHEFLELDADDIRSKIGGVRRIAGQFKILPEPGRTIVREHVAYGVSLTDIAQRMGFSEESSAKKNKYKALIKLIEAPGA